MPMLCLHGTSFYYMFYQGLILVIALPCVSSMAVLESMVMNRPAPLKRGILPKLILLQVNISESKTNSQNQDERHENPGRSWQVHF
jgi:hypothetical protein